MVSIRPLHGPLPPFSRLAHEPVAHSNKFGIHLVLHVVGGKVVVVKPGTQPLEGGEVARPPRRRKAGEGAIVVRLGVQVQRVSAPAGESAEGLFVSLENKKKKRKKKRVDPRLALQHLLAIGQGRAQINEGGGGPVGADHDVAGVDVVVDEADDVVEVVHGRGEGTQKGRLVGDRLAGPSVVVERSAAGHAAQQGARDVAAAHAAAVVADEMGVGRVARELLQVPDLARKPVGQWAVVDVVTGAEGSHPRALEVVDVRVRLGVPRVAHRDASARKPPGDGQRREDDFVGHPRERALDLPDAVF